MDLGCCGESQREVSWSADPVAKTRLKKAKHDIHKSQIHPEKKSPNIISADRRRDTMSVGSTNTMQACLRVWHSWLPFCIQAYVLCMASLGHQ